MGREVWRAGNMLYPVPAVMVSCARPSERPNIITVAWTGTVCSNPAMVSISVRPRRYSYNIIRETGEFVINLTTEKLVRATDYCGVRSGRDVDKFREMNLTAGKADMFLAEVVAVDIDDRYLDASGKFNLNKAGLIVYSHGEYLSLGEKLGNFGYSVKKRIKPS